VKIARFLQKAGFNHIDASPEKVAQAVQLSSPERMRELEKQEAGKYAQLKQTRQDKPFVRSAQAGGWKSVLSRESVALIERDWGAIMKSLGYALAHNLQEEDESRMERV
jgi:hypothetical protein